MDNEPHADTDAGALGSEFLHVDGNESQASCPINYELFIRRLAERLT